MGLQRVFIFRFWTSKKAYVSFDFEFVDATKRHQHNMYKQFFYNSLNSFTSRKIPVLNHLLRQTRAGFAIYPAQTSLTNVWIAILWRPVWGYVYFTPQKGTRT